MDLGRPEKILFITSGQPSLNPRIVKEADALANAGYSVTMLYAYWNEWGAEFDTQLIATKKWKAICIAGDPKKKWLIYFISRVIYKLANLINRLLIGKVITKLAISRPTYFLIRAAKKQKADLYIGHNMGALPATVKAAKFNNKLCGFDAEDFHRYETSDNNNNIDVILKAHLENKYIPQLSYFTTSSPQIANSYQQIFADLKPVVLLNVFPKNLLKLSGQNINKPLKLFWFSQTIGVNRGIEDIIGSLQLLDKKQFELHLLGSQLPDSKLIIDKLNKSGIVIKLYDPIFPDDIVNFATQFDIGLALENKVPFNRDVCLTNKIFTYMQAGLAIIASNTEAQQDFMNKVPQIGYTYPKGNSKKLAEILLNYSQNSDELMKCKTESLRLAHYQYNWETESLKFLQLVKDTLATGRNV